MRAFASVVLVIFVGVLGVVRPAWGLEEGDVVSDLCLTDVEGNEVCLSELLTETAEFVVIELLNVYCHTCREVVPVMNDVHAKYAGQNIPLIGIAINGSADEVTIFRERFDVQYEVLPDPERSTISIFTPENVPTLYIFDPSGTLLYRHLGKLESVEQFDRTIEHLRSRTADVGVKPGQLAPSFTLRDLEGGKVALEDEHGQRVVLGFFSDLSEGVIDQARVLNKVQRIYESKGVVVLAVFSGVAAEALAEFLKANEIQYSILLDEDSEETKDYHQAGLPHVWVINKVGRVRHETGEFISLDELVRILPPPCYLSTEDEEHWLHEIAPLASSFEPISLGGETCYEALRQDGSVIGLVRIVCRDVMCQACSYLHMIYAVDMKGRVVRMFMIEPIEHCGGRQPANVVEQFKQQIMGYSVCSEPLVMGQNIFGISESTGSTEQILDGINETQDLFEGYKNPDFMVAGRTEKCFAHMRTIHEAVVKYNEEHPDDPMISLDLEKLRGSFPGGENPTCPLDGTYILTDFGGKKVILCTFHGVDLEHYGIRLE